MPPLMIFVSFPFLVHSVFCSSSVPGPHWSEGRQFCQFETFNATCAQHESVLITSATYGRLALGRCVTRDYGYLGCSADVIGHLDKACAGRRKCLFHVPVLRELVHPCPKDLTAYLDVGFVCVPEIVIRTEPCNSIDIILDGNSAILRLDEILKITSLPSASPSSPSPSPSSSSSSSSSGLTLNSDPIVPKCTITIATGKGQTMKVTALNFGDKRDNDDDGDGDGDDDDDGDDDSFCGVELKVGQTAKNFCTQIVGKRRTEVVPPGDHSSVQVLLDSRVMTSPLFGRQSRALFFEVVGCRDVTPSWNAYQERTGDEMVIRCNYTRETWTLTCRNNTWIGTVKNCTDVPRTDELGWSSRPRFLPNGLLVAVIVGAVFGVVSGVLLLLCVYVCQKRKERCNTSKDNINETSFDRINTSTFGDDDVMNLKNIPESDRCPENKFDKSTPANNSRSKNFKNLFKFKTFPRGFSVKRSISNSFPAPPPRPTFVGVEQLDVPLQAKERRLCHGTASDIPAKANILRSALWRKNSIGDIEETRREKSNVDVIKDSCFLCRVDRYRTLTPDLMTARDCQFCTVHEVGRDIFFTKMSAEMFAKDSQPSNE